MHEPFLVIGLILASGFVANVIFERTRISQVLILIALGFLLGPVFGIADASKGSVLANITPFVGTLALVILLFDGGITLNVFELIRALPKATAFTLVTFVLSVATTAALAALFFNWNALYGILLGAALGGTSSAIVIAMVEKAKASRETKSLLVLESTITDALCIITAVVVIQIIKAKVPMDFSSVLNLLAGAFSIALLAGALAAVAWLTVLKKLSRREFPYMLTLAVVFLVYGLVETAKGNGGIAVFAFGLVLGNAKRAAEFLNIVTDVSLDIEIEHIQEEVTFFTRTFFFVFLGVILAPAGLTLVILAFSIALLALFLFMRWVGQKIVLSQSPDSKLLVTMLPRGLAAAVLAGLPSSEGIAIPGFVEIALLSIIFTNIAATVGVFTTESAPQATPRVVATKQADQKKK